MSQAVGFEPATDHRSYSISFKNFQQTFVMLGPLLLLLLLLLLLSLSLSLLLLVLVLFDLGISFLTFVTINKMNFIHKKETIFFFD